MSRRSRHRLTVEGGNGAPSASLRRCRMHRLAFCFSLICALQFFAGCRKAATPTANDPARSTETVERKKSAGPGAGQPQAGRVREVYATWYEVPADSLAARRAGPGELTAAHNHLPIGTRLRVTHLANGKSVIVRITDRGITGRKMKLDLCKQAAEQLEMIREGMAKVRMEVLPADAPAAQNSPAG